MQAFAYEPMLAMITSGKLQPQQLVGRRITLEEAPQALAAMNSFPGTGITVIDRF
jgi:alcohol dehydrogenase